ncbi:MAG TPA: ATP-binding protein [Polyangiaceae bacterium]
MQQATVDHQKQVRVGSLFGLPPDITEPKSIDPMLSHAILITDVRGKVRWHSPNCKEFVAAWAPGDTLDLLRGDFEVPGQGRISLPDGRDITWTSHPMALRMSDLELSLPKVGVLWTFDEVGLERQMLLALREAEERLRLFSAHMHGIVFELDADGRFVNIWTSDDRLLAVPAAKLVGRTVVEALGKDLGQRHHDAALETARTGRKLRYEYEMEVPDGQRYFVCESAAMPGPRPGERHAVFWIRDITEQVELRKRLQRAEWMAAVGTLAAGVAHEINNPLAYIMLNVEQLRSALTQLDAAQESLQVLSGMQSNVEMIAEGSRRVQRIVRDLICFAQTDAAPQPTDLQRALGEAIELTKHAWPEWAKLTFELGPATNVFARHQLLVQLFTHLLTNAIDALIPEQADRCVIHLSVESMDADSIAIEVRDTGRGVPPENAARIFDPFFTTKTAGTGLGLSICRRIVESAGGELRYEPEPHGGSVFRVILRKAP